MSMKGFEPPRSYPHTVIPEPSNKFTTIYGTLMFITVFTAVRYVRLSSNALLQCIASQLPPARSILILSSNPRIGLQTRLICRISPPNVCIYLSSPICVTRSATKLPSFYHQTNIWWNVQIVTSSKFNFLLPSYIPISSPNILVCNTISFSSSLKIRNHLSHP
jgi:hypothetical protein